MLRCFYLGLCALFLLMSCTQPRAQQSDLLTAVYQWLFLACMVLYIPMAGVAVYYLLKAISLSVKQRSFKAGASALWVSMAISAALMSFDRWIFSELL